MPRASSLKGGARATASVSSFWNRRTLSKRTCARARKEIQDERDRSLVDSARHRRSRHPRRRQGDPQMNLDDRANRKLVDDFLAGLESKPAAR